MLRTSAKLAGLTAAAASAATGTMLARDDDLRKRAVRTYTFWSRSLPIYAQYRYMDWKTKTWTQEERDAAFMPLHERNVDKVVGIVRDLRGFYIKLAQVVSTRGDFVPKIYLDELSKFQDDVDPVSGAVVREIIERDLGLPVDELFADFEDEPLGAASIGQVHAARLRRDGSKVAVKVIYPETEALFGLDIATMIAFVRMAQPESLPLMREVRSQFMKEMDMRREAWCLRTIGDHVRATFGERLLVIPRPVDDLAARHVLVMERLDGGKLMSVMMDQYEAYAKRHGTTVEALREKMEDAERKRVASGEGPMQPPSRARVLVLGTLAAAVRRTANVAIGAYNWTAGFVTGPLAYIDRSAEPLDSFAIMHGLLDNLGSQVFDLGVFHADPHPGNIFLQPDGRLALIDFGQTKRMSVADRLALARLIVALDEDDKEAIVAEMRAMGFSTRTNSPYTLEKLAQVFFNRDDFGTTEGLNIQSFLEKLGNDDPTVDFPDHFVMASRASLLLRGLGTLLQHPVQTARFWRPYADRLLREHAQRVEPPLPPPGITP